MAHNRLVTYKHTMYILNVAVLYGRITRKLKTVST